MSSSDLGGSSTLFSVTRLDSTAVSVQVSLDNKRRMLIIKSVLCRPLTSRRPPKSNCWFHLTEHFTRRIPADQRHVWTRGLCLHATCTPAAGTLAPWRTSTVLRGQPGDLTLVTKRQPCIRVDAALPCKPSWTPESRYIKAAETPAVRPDFF